MRILIFGTVYADTYEKLRLARQWTALNNAINRGCDFMLVDSASPLDVFESGRNIVMYTDGNIGHLSRGGQDGWGRAFCAGLEWAMSADYDYVVHIEGDSLFRLPVTETCTWMEKNDARSLVTSVHGTKNLETNWVETGIMFFSVPYLQESNFVDRYNWRDGVGKKYPHTPEAVVWKLLGDDLDFLSIVNIRDDCKVLTVDNVHKYDWITHTAPEVFDAFFEFNMPKVPA